MFLNACRMFKNACWMFQNFQVCMQVHELACSYINLHEVPACSRMHAECSRMHAECLRMHAECSRIFRYACRSMSLHAGPWACMQLHNLAWSFMRLCTVPFFVWAAHKNFEVLVYDDLTCISLTVQTKVASWPTSTVILFISSTNLGFIFIPAPAARKEVFSCNILISGWFLPFWACVTRSRERSTQYLWLILILSIFYIGKSSKKVGKFPLWGRVEPYSHIFPPP